MRGLLILLTAALMMSSCEKHEEILPAPPPPVAPSPLPEPVAEVVNPPAPVINSELYQYANFETMPYRILVPRNYDPAKKYPLHVFLHGLDERGTDNEKQLELGATEFQVDSVRQKYPAFIIFPQCPSSYYWFSDPVPATLKNLIDDVVKKHAIDPAKISIGGFSMGGYGTFAMVASYPGFFEAAVAISGDGDKASAPRMISTRWEIFAGQKDNVVASSKTEEMAKALIQAGAPVSWTLFPNATHHNTWAKAFSTPDFYLRLFNPGD